MAYFSIIPEIVMKARKPNGNKLNADAKIMYGVINSLTKKYGYCTASNKYLAKVYECSEVTASRYVSELKECGLIKTYVDQKQNSSKRKIWTVETMAIKEGLVSNQNIAHINSDNSSYQDRQEPLINTDKQLVNNINKSISKSNKKNMSSSDEHDHIPYSEIIDYLNQKASTKYRHTTAKTKSLIKARWKEGNRVDDFKQVVNNKVSEWSGSDMARYLRPDTLFGTKFEGYLNQSNGNSAREQRHQEMKEVYGF